MYIISYKKFDIKSENIFRFTIITIYRHKFIRYNIEM